MSAAKCGHPAEETYSDGNNKWCGSCGDEIAFWSNVNGWVYTK